MKNLGGAKPRMIQVEGSSCIAALGWSAEDRRLWVEYVTTDLWSYYPIERNEWALIAQAHSKGKAVHAVKQAVQAGTVSAQRVRNL